MGRGGSDIVCMFVFPLSPPRQVFVGDQPPGGFVTNLPKVVALVTNVILLSSTSSVDCADTDTDTDTRHGSVTEC